MLYGAVVWWPRAEKTTSLSALERGLVVRSISGAPRTAPTAALGIIMRLKPIHNAIIGSAIMACLRLRQARIWNNSDAHTKLLQDLSFGQTADMPTVKTSIKFCFQRKYRVIIPVRSDNSHPSLPPNGDVWYTSAAKSSNNVGLCVYHWHNGRSFYRSLSRHLSIFLGEVMTILTCAHTAFEQTSGDEDYICSNSQAAIRVLEKAFTHSSLVWEYMVALNRLAGVCRRLTIWWVPAHAGIKGNEVADDLAKLGNRATFIGPEPVCGTNVRKERVAVSG